MRALRRALMAQISTPRAHGRGARSRESPRGRSQSLFPIQRSPYLPAPHPACPTPPVPSQQLGSVPAVSSFLWSFWKLYRVPAAALPGPNPQLAKKQTSYLPRPRGREHAWFSTGTGLMKGLRVSRSGFPRMAHGIERSRKSNSGRLLAGESPDFGGLQPKPGGLKKRDSDVREDSGSGPGWLYLMASSSELCL